MWIFTPRLCIQFLDPIDFCLMKRAIVCAVPFLLVLAGLVKAVYFQHIFFRLYGHENRYPGAIGEWLQFYAYFCAFLLVVIGVLSARKIGKLALSRRLALVFALLAFFVAMEEVSWGQKIMFWSTPESLQNLNIQGEANFHNIRSFQGLTHLGYALIGLWGGLGFLFVHKPRFQKFRIIIPPWSLAPYFLLPGIFYVFKMLDLAVSWQQELFELVLALGFLFLALRINLYFRRKAYSAISPLSS